MVNSLQLRILISSTPTLSQLHQSVVFEKKSLITILFASCGSKLFGTEASHQNGMEMESPWKFTRKDLRRWVGKATSTLVCLLTMADDTLIISIFAFF